ncbi:MAG: hypothetical protein CENE_02585 [Candidatus Celerinatantimonas neptuna]|nr:MAG: hypothetical protein CENE_02585 [Candidatus Celerinatantimonas neptuna]
MTRSITKEGAKQCTAEPIHHIGNIRPHGFQLIMDPQPHLLGSTLKISSNYLIQRS